MSPAQYRALEQLVAADWIGVKVGDVNGNGTIHRATAQALARRGLAVVVETGLHAPYAKATTAGRRLLATSEPITASGSKHRPMNRSKQ